MNRNRLTVRNCRNHWIPFALAVGIVELRTVKQTTGYWCSLFGLSLLFLVSTSAILTAQNWDMSNVNPDAARYLQNAQQQEAYFSSSAIPGSYQPMRQSGYQSDQSAYLGFGPTNAVHPRFFVEGVFLSRSKIDPGVFVFDDNGSVMDYDDLSLGMGGGLRVGMQYFAPDETGWEFAFLTQDDQQNSVVTGPNVTPFFFNGIPADPEPSWDVDYDSELRSYEFNRWVRHNSRTRMGFGTRQISLRENFNILSTADPTSGFRSDSDNDLFGGQLMIERNRPLGHGLQLVLGGKAGGYYNNVDVRAFALNGQIHREDSQFSFVGDFKAGLTMDVNSLVRLQAGYQGLIMTDLALAPNQSETLAVLDQNFGEIDFGTIFFHGFYFGGTLAF